MHKISEDTTGRFMITVKRDESLYIGADPISKEIDDVKERIETEINANPRFTNFNSSRWLSSI